MTPEQCLEAMYVIGEVESHWDWQAVNYADPITLGMMQWYGTRAAGLLSLVKDQDPAGYAMLAQSLKDTVGSLAPSDRRWNSRYLTRAEGDSWRNAAARPEVHKIQQDLFIGTDIPAYVQVLTSWGLSESNVKTLIFGMAMYHQGPRYAGQVIATVGDSDLDTMWRTCLNHRVLGQYRNRYNTVHDRLAAWDGISAPPDFGQDTGDAAPDTPGGDAGAGSDNGHGGVTVQQSGIKRVTYTGDQIIVHTAQSPQGILCTHGLGDEWLPCTNSAGTPPTGGTGQPGGNTTPTPTPDDDITKMQQLWFDNARKWQYGQGAGRLNPPQSGFSDCSACIWWAIHTINPGKAAQIGTYTGSMVNNGIEIARGTDCATLPLDKMRAGDIILLEWGTPNYAFNSRHSHVEWYIGNNHIWGAGSAPLPHDSGQATTIGHSGWPTLGCYMVRRIL